MKWVWLQILHTKIVSKCRHIYNNNNNPSRKEQQHRNRNIDTNPSCGRNKFGYDEITVRNKIW